jgi:hypothetical protein
MSGRYAFYYGISTAVFGYLDSALGLNLGSMLGADAGAQYQAFVGTAVHAMMATWAMDNFGLPLGVGSTATRYIALPAAAGGAFSIFGSQIATWVGGIDKSNAAITTFATEALSAALGVYVFSRAI